MYMKKEIIDIIDENENVIGQCNKVELYTKKYLHQIVHVLLFNDKNELLLQLRAKNKSYLPGYWVTSVGGHVMSGETPKSAALREMEEEIGILLDIQPYKKVWWDSTDEIGLRKQLIIFTSNSNGPFKVFEDEVERVEFFPIDQIKKMIRDGAKIHPELKFIIENLIN